MKGEERKRLKDGCRVGKEVVWLYLLWDISSLLLWAIAMRKPLEYEVCQYGICGTANPESYSVKGKDTIA